MFTIYSLQFFIVIRYNHSKSILMIMPPLALHVAEFLRLALSAFEASAQVEDQHTLAQDESL